MVTVNDLVRPNSYSFVEVDFSNLYVDLFYFHSVFYYLRRLNSIKRSIGLLKE